MSITVDEIVQAILLPSHVPADDLYNIAAALTKRFTSDSVARWRINLPDLVVDQDEYPLLSIERVERLTGKTWQTIAPGSSARDCVAILRVAYEDVAKLTPEQAQARLAELTTTVVESFEEYTREVVGPFGAGAPVTG